MASKICRHLDKAKKLAFDDTSELQKTPYQPWTWCQRDGYFGPDVKRTDLLKFASTYVVVTYAVMMEGILPKYVEQIINLCHRHFAGEETIPDRTFEDIRDSLKAMTKDNAARQDNQSKQQMPYLGAATLMKELQEFEELNEILQLRDDDELDELEERQKHASAEISGGNFFGTDFTSRRKNNLPDLRIRDLEAPLKLVFEGEEDEEKHSRILVLNDVIMEVLIWKHVVVDEKFFQKRTKTGIAKPPAWMRELFQVAAEGNKVGEQ